MKKQLSKLRRLFSRTGTRKLDATATREAIPVSYDDDDGSTRLSGAFIIVLILHVVALIGVYTYHKMAEKIPAASQANAGAKAPAPTPATPKAPLATQAPALGAPAPTPAPQTEASAAPADLPPIPPPAAKGGRTHIVKAGETLTRIAVAYSVSKTDLANANGIRNENELRTGQELSIPAAKSTKPETKPPAPVKVAGGTYTVRKGETLAKIANNLGVKYEDLIKANNIKDPKKLQDGQKLKVPGK